MMTVKYLLSFFLLFSGLSLNVSDQPYVKAIARPGDSPISLLSWYGVNEPECNVDLFYKINKLRKEDGLIANQPYMLPIFLYIYNGKSIRTTIGNNNLEKAERIQDYNQKMYDQSLQVLPYRESKLLWVPAHELQCEETTAEINVPSPAAPKIKTTSGKRQFTIFGKDNAHVPLESEKLAGKVFYVVGGHGGPDPGAVSWHNKQKLCEDEYAYDIALRLARKLIANGAVAYVITRDPNDGIRSGKYLPCDKDEKCWENETIPINQKQRLQQRADAVNELYLYNKKKGVKTQRMIALHIDARSTGERIDVFFYHHAESKKGKKIAQNLQATFRQKYDFYQKGRGYSGTVEDRDLFMLRETFPTAVYVELGNIKNRKDQDRFIIESNREALAKWLYEGLLKEF